MIILRTIQHVRDEKTGETEDSRLIVCPLLEECVAGHCEGQASVRWGRTQLN
jgi:hypothetical protein